mmetsp:Transcript_9377/g.10691  ORF Transcript_9377/g.10691 Transcript_9377/m.10691 type:complete len:324 (-) Transcript_9377:878-1849(-)
MDSCWDSPVEATSDEAALSKLSAIAKGYYKDDFMKVLVGGNRTSKRSPLINRGYFARVAARDMVVKRFLEVTEGKCQIVSLGAGSDTAYFRLKAENQQPLLFAEIDLPAVVIRKMKIISGNQGLLDLIGITREELLDSAKTQLCVKTNDYVLASADLRKVEDFDAVLKNKCGLDLDLPTLFISECVLVYLEPSDSANVISWISSTFKSAAMFVYEQIRPDDAFGQVMMRNLESRGCPLKGLKEHISTDAQINRFESRGWTKCECLDMNNIYYKCIDQNIRSSAEKLEIFDEFEEWHLMQAHYCVVLGKKDEEDGILTNLKLQY